MKANFSWQEVFQHCSKKASLETKYLKINWGLSLESNSTVSTSKRYAHIAIFKIITKDLLYRMWNSAQCDVAAWMGGELGENGYLYMCD